jgi:hypothetical protein
MASLIVAYILWLFLGIIGIHRFYTGNIFTGIIWMFTLGLLGIGWIFDIVKVPELVEKANIREQQRRQQSGLGGLARGFARDVAKDVTTNTISDYIKNK